VYGERVDAADAVAKEDMETGGPSEYSGRLVNKTGRPRENDDEDDDDDGGDRQYEGDGIVGDDVYDWQIYKDGTGAMMTCGRDSVSIFAWINRFTKRCSLIMRYASYC